VIKYKHVQILTPHSPNCCIKDDNFNRVWVCPEYAAWGKVKRDLAGRNNHRAQHGWLKFRCNDPSCDGTLIAYLPMIMGAIAERFR